MTEVRPPRTLDAKTAREVRKKLPDVMARMDTELATPVPPYRPLSTGPCDFKGRPDCSCGGTNV